jgi:hypothetical protein
MIEPTAESRATADPHAPVDLACAIDKFVVESLVIPLPVIVQALDHGGIYITGPVFARRSSVGHYAVVLPPITRATRTTADRRRTGALVTIWNPNRRSWSSRSIALDTQTPRVSSFARVRLPNARRAPRAASSGEAPRSSLSLVSSAT